MKNIAFYMAIVTALVSLNLIYPATMKVVEVDAINDIVTLETATGHAFSMDGIEDWQNGDIASLLMFSRGTSQINDDIILSAKYSGFSENNFS